MSHEIITTRPEINTTEEIEALNVLIRLLGKDEEKDELYKRYKDSDKKNRNKAIFDTLNITKPSDRKFIREVLEATDRIELAQEGKDTSYLIEEYTILEQLLRRNIAIIKRYNPTISDIDDVNKAIIDTLLNDPSLSGLNVNTIIEEYSKFYAKKRIRTILGTVMGISGIAFTGVGIGTGLFIPFIASVVVSSIAIGLVGYVIKHDYNENRTAIEKKEAKPIKRIFSKFAPFYPMTGINEALKKFTNPDSIESTDREMMFNNYNELKEFAEKYEGGNFANDFVNKSLKCLSEEKVIKGLEAHLNQVHDTMEELLKAIPESMMDNRHKELMKFAAKIHDLFKGLTTAKGQITADHYILLAKFIEDNFTNKVVEMEALSNGEVEFLADVIKNHENIHHESECLKVAIDDTTYTTPNSKGLARMFILIADVITNSVVFNGESRKIKVSEETLYRYLDLCSRHINPETRKIFRPEWVSITAITLIKIFDKLIENGVSVDTSYRSDILDGVINVMNNDMNNLNNKSEESRVQTELAKLKAFKQTTDNQSNQNQ